jgi:mRNA deadenylase 3'-5' endonuclease subunit Ccr4
LKNTEHLKVSKLLELPNEKEVSQEEALPNSVFGSDHIPLICEF